MPYFSRLFRPIGHRVSSRQAHIETLEPRQLLSSGPLLSGMEVTGTVHHATSVVLHFNENLIPATAQDVQAYVFGRVPPSSPNNGPSIGDILGFLSRPKQRLIRAGKINFTSATYNDATRTVTLTPLRPFNAQPFFRLLRVRGAGAHAVKDLAGNPFSGGADLVLHWTLRQGRHLRFTDSNGDTVTLSLKGRGNLYVFLRRSGPPLPYIFADRTNPASILTASLKPAAHGNGIADIIEFEGVGSHLKTNLLTSPQFQVRTTEP